MTNKKTNLIDVGQLSKSISLSQSYIYALVGKRKIPFYKPFGKKLYFKLDEVIEHMSNSRVAPVDMKSIKQDAADYMLKRGGKNV